MITLATTSSMGVPKKTMRSLSRRLKMSQPRSPRWVCSTTVGMVMAVGCMRLKEILRS